MSIFRSNNAARFIGDTQTAERDEARIADLDRQLGKASAEPMLLWTPQTRALLDLRNAIRAPRPGQPLRPAVPYISGGAS